MTAILPVNTPDIHTIIDATLLGLASNGSRRVYLNTYEKWIAWCEQTGTHPLLLTGMLVNDFLKAQPVTKTTRQQYLSALRTLVAFLAIHHPGFEPFYKEIQRLKAPNEGLGGQERNKLALTPAQVERVLHFWQGRDDRIAIRNHLLLCCGLATGGRRSEIVAIEWRDVDLENGTIVIRHGKGDHQREVAIVGDFGIEAFQAWRAAQGEGWRYVFVGVNKGGKIGPDQPIDVTSYYKMVKAVAADLGYDFATHDFRRTLITELLRMKAPQRDVQAQAGHADPSTTQRYALAADASTRRKEFRVRWG
jgi:integrase